MQSKIKSKAAWGALVAQIILVLGIFVPPDITQTVQIILGAVMVVVGAFGFWNSPENKTHY